MVWWIKLIIMVVASYVAAALAPKPPQPKPAGLDELDVPQADEGRAIGMVFGHVIIKAATLAWFGNLTTEKIKVRTGNVFGHSKQTVGFRYKMGLHFALCRTLDRLDEIIVGERVAWRGPIEASGEDHIGQWELFGGDKREGGVEGYFDFMLGDAAQAQNDYLVSQLGDLIPAYRGVVSVVFKGGRVTANTPYVKPWWFRCQRIQTTHDGSEQWYPEKAEIVGGADGLAFDSSGWSYQIIAHHSDPGTTNLTPPVGGWTDDVSEPFGGGVQTPGDQGPPYNTTWPIKQILWAKKEIPSVLYDRNVTFHVWAENGAVITLEGITTVTINVNNTEPNPEQGLNTFTAFIPIFASPLLTVKAYDETAPGGGTYFAIGFNAVYGSMNPAHIIRECLTDPYMRMNYPESMIDDDSFTTAADTFYGEGMGLNFFWAQQTPVKEFIQTVLDHCGAVYYADPFTGKFKLKAIRGDYDVDELEEFDESSIISVESFERSGAGEIVNEISVQYFDIGTGKDAVLTVQDLASINSQGAIVADTRQYPGIGDAALAARVAQRDLTASTSALARLSVRFTRVAATIRPGDVIKLSWAKLGISELICRVLDISYGGLNNGEVRAELAEDVFGLPSASYQAQQPTGWEETDQDPLPVAAQYVMEATYWDAKQDLAPGDFAALADTDGLGYTVAEAENAAQYDYSIYSRISPDEYELAVEGEPFALRTQLATAVLRSDTEIEVEDTGDGEFGLAIAVGDRLLLPGGTTEEQMEVTDLTNLASGIIGVNRAILDTTPQVFASDVDVWLLEYTEEDFGREGILRTDGDTVDYKLLSASGRGESDIDDATEESLTFASRIFRPYPPAKIRINTEAFPAGTVTAGFTIDWAHRDRLLQTSSFVDQDAASIGPEAGTTYNIYFYDDDTDTLKHAELNVNDDTFTMPDVAGTFNARLEIAAERDGVESWERQIREFSYAGSFPIRGVMLSRSTSVSLTVSTNTYIAWDTEVGDWGGYWSSGSEVTVPGDAAGWHIITSNMVKDLGTATWYSNDFITEGSSAYPWTSGPNVWQYEGIVTSGFDEHHSNAALVSIPAGGTARVGVNWFTGSGSRTVEAGAKFSMARVYSTPSRGVSVWRTSSSSISNTTDTTVTWTTEILDEGGFYDSGTSTSRLTVPTGEAGWYVIASFADWATVTVATARKTMIRKNGAGPWLGARRVTLSSSAVGGEHTCPALAIAYLSDADYVEERVHHNHGSSLDLKTAAVAMAKADSVDTIGARVSYAGTAQTCNSGSTVITFDTEDNDDDGMVDLGSNNTRITATVDGLYLIAGGVGFAANTGTTRQAILRVDGSTEIAKDGSRADATAVNSPILNPGAVYYLTTGQYVELVGITGTNTSTLTGDDRPWLAMLLLGADD